MCLAFGTMIAAPFVAAFALLLALWFCCFAYALKDDDDHY
jgi:hypothetical protein